MLPGTTAVLVGAAQSSVQQQAEIKRMVSKGGKTAADAARLFKAPPSRGCWIGHPPPLRGRPGMPNSAEETMPNNSKSDTPSRFWGQGESVIREGYQTL